MKIEFEVPDGVRLCSFRYDNVKEQFQFRACVAGDAIMGVDGTLRPHAIEVGYGPLPQDAIDKAVLALRIREEELRNWVRPTPVKSLDLDLKLDLSGI